MLKWKFVKRKRLKLYFHTLSMEKFTTKPYISYLSQLNNVFYQFHWIDYVTPRFWPHGIEIVHHVYIVFKSWRGAQGQGHAIDLVFYVSAIKVDDDGSSAGQEWYILRYHVNMKFNKIPQLAMHCNKRDGGVISQGIGRGFIQTLDPIGWDQMLMREPIISHLPFSSSVLNYSILP